MRKSPYAPAVTKWMEEQSFTNLVTHAAEELVTLRDTGRLPQVTSCFKRHLVLCGIIRRGRLGVRGGGYEVTPEALRVLEVMSHDRQTNGVSGPGGRRGDVPNMDPGPNRPDPVRSGHPQPSGEDGIDCEEVRTRDE